MKPSLDTLRVGSYIYWGYYPLWSSRTKVYNRYPYPAKVLAIQKNTLHIEAIRNDGKVVKRWINKRRASPVYGVDATRYKTAWRG